MIPNNLHGGQPSIPPFHINFAVPPPPLPANVPRVYHQPPPLPPPPPPPHPQPHQALSPQINNTSLQTHVTNVATTTHNTLPFHTAQNGVLYRDQNENRGPGENMYCTNDCEDSCVKCLQGKMRVEMYLERQRIFDSQEEYYSLMCTKAEKDIKTALDMVAALVGPETSSIVDACVALESEDTTSLQSTLTPVISDLMCIMDSSRRSPSVSHPGLEQQVAVRPVRNNTRTSQPPVPVQTALVPRVPQVVLPGQSGQYNHYTMRPPPSSPNVHRSRYQSQQPYTRHGHDQFYRNNGSSGRHYSNEPHHHRRFHRQPPAPP